MLTRTRLAVLFLLSALVLTAVPASAQIHGVPPSVTSFGFGGSNNPTPGVPASVTSLGPLGFDCCSGPFIVPFHSHRAFDGHRFQHHQEFPVGQWMPAYIPYLVPYPVPYDEYSEDDYNGDVDRAYSRGVPAVYDRGPWYRDSPAPRRALTEAPPAGKEDAELRAAAVAPEPAIVIAPLPPTVLVYKDGHKLEVQNYAILGDTLFDFTGNLSHKIHLADLDLPATRKTNDDRGVDFQIPGEKNQ